MNRISACVITLNEEHNLPRLLASLAGIVDEVIVVDSGSTDRTEAVAQERGVRFCFRAWTNYAEQKNYAAAVAELDWILSIDADEELSSALQSSLLDWKKREAKFQVYEVSRRAWYVGKWIKHGGWYPDLQKRLYHRDRATFSGQVHESLRFDGEVGRLEGDLLHYTIRSYEEHVEKVERYSALSGQQMYAAGKRSWRGGMWIAAPWTFLQKYLLQLGVLDGSRGLMIARMTALGVWLKFRKLGELCASEKPPAAEKIP